ncbi:MAG: ABC transporter permease [Trueperaceae bacterium]
MQLVLAVVAVAVAVAAFAAVATVDVWQRQQIEALADVLAPDVLVLRYEGAGGVWAGPTGLMRSEVAALRSLEGVVEVAWTGSSGFLTGGDTVIMRMPADETLFGVLGLNVVAGRALQAADRVSDLPVAVIGSTMAEELFGGADAAIGATLDTGLDVRRVVGVMGPVPEGLREFAYLDAAAIVPAAGQFTVGPDGSRPSTSRAFVRHAPGEREAVAERVRSALAGMGSEPASYGVLTAAQWMSAPAVFRVRVADELARGSRWVVALAIIAAIGNLVNAMTLRALDAAPTVALRRALGATRRRVLAEHLLDQSRVGVLGTLLAVALVPVAGWGLERFGVEAVVAPATFVWAAVTGVVVSLLAMLGPAIWVVRLPPARALRERLAPPAWEGIAVTGMAAGVLALVVSMGIGGGVDRWFQSSLASVGADRLVVSTRVGSFDWLTSVFAAPRFDQADVEAIRDLPSVSVAAVHSSAGGRWSLPPDDAGQPRPIALSLVDPEFFSAVPLPLVAGRTATSDTEVVLGIAAATESFPDLTPAEVIGHPLTLLEQLPPWETRTPATETLHVVGVYAPMTVMSLGDLYDYAIVRVRRPDDPPIVAGQRDLHIRLEPNADTSAATDAVAAIVSRNYAGPDARLHVHAPAADLRAARSTFEAVTTAWRTVAAVAFLVGGLGLASVTLVRLARQRSELALRRAVGARQHHVVRATALAALRIGLTAAVVGSLVGIAANHWLAGLAPWSAELPWLGVAMALLVTGCIAVVVATPPAVLSARSAPWQHLRERG